MLAVVQMNLLERNALTRPVRCLKPGPTNAASSGAHRPDAAALLNRLGDGGTRRARPPLARAGHLVDGGRPSVHGLGCSHASACAGLRPTEVECMLFSQPALRAQVWRTTRALGGAQRRSGVGKPLALPVVRLERRACPRIAKSWLVRVRSRRLVFFGVV
ncbi:hypothetical protein DFH06DRAFT_1176431 [Mycena polygramma]|nr:hypothetical protein DFH06DRAFT_1176431 [Mycena polygramma]